MNQCHGRIVANYGQHLALETQSGELRHATARKKLERVVAGDCVTYQELNSQQAIVTALHPRKTIFSRPDQRGRLKPLAANIDQLVIISARRPPLDRYLIDSYLVAAENLGLSVLLVFNKCDLADDAPLLQSWISYYQTLGYPTFDISTVSRVGIEQLPQWLIDKTSLFVGQSGVGKSSITRFLLPDKEIQIGKLSAATGLGRHTTTVTVRYTLPTGGAIIDSPGMREFAAWQHPVSILSAGFIEFVQCAESCRFHNCRHSGEPGCAVEAAVQQGGIADWRWQNYQKMLVQSSELKLARGF